MSDEASLNKLKVVYWPLEKVRPYLKNPRKISDALVGKVAKSISEFGWQQPIVVDKEGVVIVGHARLKAANFLKLAQVPVVVADLPANKAKAYRLADNRIGEEAKWDDSLLKIEIEELQNIGLDLSMTGFEIEDFSKGNKKADTIVVQEVETGPVEDRFWISVRGPLKSQAAALKKLQDALAGVEGVQVELGVIADEGQTSQWDGFQIR